MQTAFVRGIVAVLATLTLIGCGPQPQPFPTKTPAEIKQLTDVTDGVVALVGNPQDEAAFSQALAALNAARAQYDQHGEAILNQTNAEVLACIRSHTIEISDARTMISKREDAASRQDEVMVKRRDAMLWLLADNMGACAAKSDLLLIDYEKRPEALKHGAVVISQIYATVEIFRAAIGLKVAPLLEDQIRAYETVVKRLGPENAPQVVTDALPKLKAALTLLEGRPEPSR